MASLSKAPFNHFIEQRHPLAWAYFDKAPLRLGAHFPVVGVLLAGIPLDQVVDLFPGQILPVGRRIVGAIKGDQQGLIAGKRPGSGQNAVEKEEKVLLAVLIARTQFQPHAPALFSEIGADGRIAVIAVVGAGHPFLAGLAVVQAEHIGMQRHMAGGQRAHRGPQVLQHRHDAVVRGLGQRFGLFIETLA